jgi:predicted GH43/DUF377 family glycosyl hydrolase
MMLKRICFVWLFLGFFHTMELNAQLPKQVEDATMNRVYEEIKTPYKFGLVLIPGEKKLKYDCPTVFRKNGNWYMSYIVFDRRGYETWLAKSKDLLHWNTLGKMMSFSDTSDWDNNQKAGYVVLQDSKWGGSYRLKRYAGKYWMSYIGGHDRGYETGVLGIGMASTTKNPAQPHEWNRLQQPVLQATDADVRWWENKKLYKSTVVEDASRSTGYRFIMYYNANGDTSGNKPAFRWFERIGMAVSNDMMHWKRFQTDPVMGHKVGITGDAVVQKWNNLWIMFYFGAFWEGRKNKDAFNRFACSYDGIHWTDWKGEDLIAPSENYDATYAHKSYVLKYKGVVYHFYCAVDKKDNRGIAVATSSDLGKSGKQFIE